MGITSNWKHGFICTCSFHNWFSDMQMVLQREKYKSQQVNKKKDDRQRNFKEKAKVENRLRIEGRGIEIRIKGLKEEGKWTEKRKTNLKTLRSLRLMDVPLQDRVHQQLLGLKKLYKEINHKLSPTPTTEKVGPAFIVTRGVRPNTYLMDSAHQRYRCIH